MDLNKDSGFIDGINHGMKDDISNISKDRQYNTIRPYYVSASGHSRLLTATKYGKRYVLKCLKEDFLYTPVYQQALRKEFEIGFQLEHPNICRTIGFEQIEGLGMTIVMEYVDGNSLQSLLGKHEITLELAKKIVAELTDALEYMHNKQIIHRDLKPSNIMITNNGNNVKLIDFGLSDSDSFCILKIPAGTTGYIAPELFLPAAKSTPSADIYSFGMIIGDLANATNDRRLHHLAKVCANRNLEKRPKNIAQLRKASRNEHKVRSVIIMFAIMSAALASSIVYYYAADHKPYYQEQTATDSTATTGENIILDYNQWK